MSQVGELYQDLSADIRVPELVAFLRTTLRPGLVVPAFSITLRFQERPEQVAEQYASLVTVRVGHEGIEKEVRRIALAIQGKLLIHAASRTGFIRYLLTADAPNGKAIGSMEFLLERARPAGSA